MNFLKNKTVLVTGHTGFKGSWLCAWLVSMGARVIGLSIDIPSIPSNFQVSKLQDLIDNDVIHRSNILGEKQGISIICEKT